jgi:hypothetical protein
MKQGSLFCFVCHFEISQTMLLHVAILVSFQKALMIRGALTWFEIVWSNSVEAIDY